jgi:archaellum component FlaC
MDSTAVLQQICQRLSTIEERLTKIEDSTDNMDDHIGFITKVFETIQQPFYLLMNTVSRISSIPKISSGTALLR